MLRRATAALFILVIATSMSQLTQELRNTNRDGDVILSISDEQKNQYLSQNFESDAYKYGYDVNPHGQFHHETRGPHGITYGCYGYVDPFGQLKATFYISDGWGYRVVQPGRDVELFLHKHEHHANGDKHDHHEHHGVITPWRELYFPVVCAQYTNTNVPPLAIPSGGTPIGSGSTIETIPTRPPYKPDSSGHPNKPGRPGKPGQPPYTGHPHPGTPGTPGIVESPLYPTHITPEKPSGTPSYPGYPIYPGETPDSHSETSGKPDDLSHPGIINTPPNRPSFPFKPGKPGTPGIPGIHAGKPGTPLYYYPVTSETPDLHSETSGKPDLSHPGIIDTPSNSPSFPFKPGKPGTPGIPGIHAGKPGTPSYIYPVTSETPDLHFETSGKPDLSHPGIINTPSNRPSFPFKPGKPGTPGIPGIHAGKPGTPSYIYPVTSETPDLHFETSGKPDLSHPGIINTPSNRPSFPFKPGKPGTPGIPGIHAGKPGTPSYIYPVTSETPDLHSETSGKPDLSHPGIINTPSNSPSFPFKPGKPGTPGIPGIHAGKPGTPSYYYPVTSETPDLHSETSGKPDLSHPGIINIPSNRPSFPFKPGKPGTPGTPAGKPGTTSYPGYPIYPVTLETPDSHSETSGKPDDLSHPGIINTPSNRPSFPFKPGKPGTPGIPGIHAGKPGTPSYIYPVTSETPDLHSETSGKPDLSHPGIINTPSNRPSFPFKPGKPGYPSYPTYPGYTEDSKSPEGPIGPEGPTGNEGPIGGVGSIGDIGGVGDEGGVGPDGPDGPWPTGSPGPDGPWPGDPDYIPGVKPTRRPSYKEPIRNHHPAIYSFNTDKYNSISQYNFSNKTDSSHTGYKDIELSKLSHPTKVNSSLYIPHKSQYETQSTSSIYGKEETNYNANKINALLHTGSTPSSLSYEIGDHQYTDVFKLNPQLYDQLIHTEPQQIKKPFKNDFKQFSVHDQNQYQKSIFYPSYNSQRQSKVANEFKKLEREEDAFNVDGQYNNSANVDSKAISNVFFQSDGLPSAPERQVNARLEQTFRTNPVIDAIGVQPPSSINVKPFSLPIGPNPQACPCYLVEPNNNTNVETSSTLTSVIGQLGFIPVIFVPYCPGNEMDSNKMKIMFPSANPVPYACDTCDTHDNKFIVKPLDINQLGNIDYLKEALNQTNLGFLNVPVKTVERRRSKSRKAK